MTQQAHFDFSGQAMVADASGALYWKSDETLIVSDLHFEKGSALAQRRCMHVPPYDTRATLRCLHDVLDRYRPRRVICLGDSFHDRDAYRRMDADDCAMLRQMAVGRDWIWITGNHDPQLQGCVDGVVVAHIALSGLVFRHQAEGDVPGEISGHYHPKAALMVDGRRLSGKCFVLGKQRLIMPAFGAYTGGLNVLDPAIGMLFDDDVTVAMIGEKRVVRLPLRKLVL